MLGVDEKRNRLVIVSSEPNARVAALMQVDVQAAMPAMKVLVARPIVFVFGVIARGLFPDDASAIFDPKKFQSFGDRLGKLPERLKKKVIDRQLASFMPQIAMAFENITLPTITQIVDVIQQLNNLDWKEARKAVENEPQNASISLAGLRHIDNLAIDRKNGVCPLPLYEFSGRDWGLLAGDGHLDDLRERLKDLGIYQYFFPAQDQLALGLAERMLSNKREMIDMIERAPKLGHPFGDLELVKDRSSVPKVLEELMDLGYLAEGEHGVEITPDGSVTRSIIRFRPRESVFQRILNRFSMNLSISPKDFFHG